MSTHSKHEEKNCFYFVTFTCYQWKPLIEKTKLYDYLEQWLNELKKRHIITSAYVFMPNHVHLLIYVKEESKGLNSVLGNGKRFMAYEIIKRLKKSRDHLLLEHLSKGVQEKERLKGKKHQVFRLSFDAKKIQGKEIEKVIDYIHHNPVSGKWNLIEDFSDFPYSSAGFYEKGKKTNVLVDFKEVFSESSTSDSEGR